MKIIEKLKECLKAEIQENENEMTRIEMEWVEAGLNIYNAWSDSYYQEVETRASQTKKILKKLEELKGE